MRTLVRSIVAVIPSGLIVLSLSGFLPGVAVAQDCTILRFGGPNRFSPTTIDNLGELQSMFSERRGEIEGLLREAGWSGNAADLFAAVRSGSAITESSYGKGTPFQWMMLRRGGTPALVNNRCWGGARPFSAWAIDVESNGRRWSFVVPHACGNVALVGSQELPRQAPPPPAPAPTPPPAPRPAPPPPAPPPPPPAEPAPAPAPEPAASESFWVFRAFGAFADDEDEHVFFETGTGPGLERQEFQLRKGWGFGVSGEYRRARKSRLGFEFGLGYLDYETHWMYDTAQVWLMDEDSLGLWTLSVAPNFHLTPDSRVDFYIGPLVGYAFADGPSFDDGGAEFNYDVDDEFMWGAQVGLDWPACVAGKCWMLSTSLKWLQIEPGVSAPTALGDYGFDSGLDPLVLTIGAGYRW